VQRETTPAVRSTATTKALFHKTVEAPLAARRAEKETVVPAPATPSTSSAAAATGGRSRVRDEIDSFFRARDARDKFRTPFRVPRPAQLDMIREGDNTGDLFIFPF
jgi:hypothetical protein